MVDYLEDEDSEIAAIGAISAALARLPDADARRRVITYVLSRYLPDSTTKPSAAPSPWEHTIQPGAHVHGSVPSSWENTIQPGAHVYGYAINTEQSQREIAGVARLTESGELRITARDLKAKSGLDAAMRLAYIAIYAHELLTNLPFSSRKGLTPLLKEWRLYDGNARAKLSRERGIIRSGDNLSLDAHARLDAERYVNDILDVDIKGSWKPK